MDPLLSRSVSNDKGSGYYFKGSIIPSNKYVDLIESDEDNISFEEGQTFPRQKVIKTGRQSEGNNLVRDRENRYKSKNKSDFGNKTNRIDIYEDDYTSDKSI